jgi:hypothetical protein
LNVPMRTLVAVMVLAAAVAEAAPAKLIARTIDYEGVTVAFPAVTYDPPADASGDPATVCARMASEALGTTVDPVRDRVAVTTHRVVLRDPTDPKRLLKIYRPDRYDADHVAKYIQRDLGLETFLRGLGIRMATVDRSPRLLERGIERVERIDGTGLDALYPNGYPAGANPAIDRVLAAIAKVDKALVGIVSRQSGLLLSNVVDCRNDVPVGVDVGYCRGNIMVEMVENGTGEVILIDW